MARGSIRSKLLNLARGLRPALRKAARHAPRDRWYEYELSDVDPRPAFLLTWYGPFDTKEDAANWARHERGLTHGLYMAVGPGGPKSWRPFQNRFELLYIGLSVNVPRRITSAKHHMLTRLPNMSAMWIAEISSQRAEVTQPDSNGVPSDLEFAEALMIHFARPKWNIRDMIHGQDRPALLRNRWHPLVLPLNKKTIPPRVPDLILYEGRETPAQLIWTDGPGGHLHAANIPPPHLERKDDLIWANQIDGDLN